MRLSATTWNPRQRRVREDGEYAGGVGGEDLIVTHSRIPSPGAAVQNISVRVAVAPQGHGLNYRIYGRHFAGATLRVPLRSDRYAINWAPLCGL
jgi:hypothetical protein